MMAEFDITSKHPDYQRWFPTWEMMRDTVKGEVAVKEKGEKYLPMKSAIRVMSDGRKRQAVYDAYKFRAEFPDIVAPTIRGLAGLIHSKDSVIELPSALDELRERATQDGLTLDQVHRRVTVELLRTGRYGLLPGVDAQGDMYLAPYVAETICNWDSKDGVPVYAVLDESTDIRDVATNKWAKLEAYRECFMTETDQFASRVWVKTDKGEFVRGDDELASVRGGNAFEEFPLVLIGSQDTTAKPDEAPLRGLASLALRAYMLDADYVNALHMVSEPTPWVSGVAMDAAPKTIGASSMWVLESSDAKAGFLEFTGPGIEAQQKAIADTLERAILFGAQLFAETRRTAESGEAIKARFGHQTSTLKLIAMSSAAGLEKALRNAALWAGGNPDEVTVDPNLDFIDHELSPQEITALVQGWLQQGYSKLTLFENLQRGGVIDPKREFDEEEELIANEDPLGLTTSPPADEIDEAPETDNVIQADFGASLENMTRALTS